MSAEGWLRGHLSLLARSPSSLKELGLAGMMGGKNFKCLFPVLPQAKQVFFYLPPILSGALFCVLVFRHLQLKMYILSCMSINGYPLTDIWRQIYGDRYLYGPH